jgi:hypothetical protein
MYVTWKKMGEKGRSLCKAGRRKYVRNREKEGKNERNKQIRT